MREKLNGMNAEQTQTFFAELDEKFSAATQKSFWSENGELIYILNPGTELKEYAEMIELILQDNAPFEHSTVVKVTDEGQSEFVSFTIGHD